MRKIAILSLSAILTLSCNAQENKKEEELPNDHGKKLQSSNEPLGTWKVDKEFDENGNLIHYDSIYSWSSADNFNALSSLDRDSILQSMQSEFYRNFSHFSDQGFDDVFSSDSLFTNKFFDDAFFKSQFGEDFRNIDRMNKRMETMRKKFLEKYQPELNKPIEGGSEDKKDDL